METPLDLRERNRDAVHHHVAMEFTNVIDDIVDTLSEGARYVILRPGAPLELIEEIPAAREHYIATRLLYEPFGGHELKLIVTDWYVFHEVRTSFRKVDDDSGTVYESPAAVFFPIDEPKKILGEFAWTMNSPAGRAQSDPNRTVLESTAATLRACEVHEELVGALGQADVEGVLSLLAEDTWWGERDYVTGANSLRVAHGRAEIGASLKAFFAVAEDIDVHVVTDLSTDWYVLSELRWSCRLHGADVEFRTISIYAIDDRGAVQGVISYGTEPEPR